MAGRWWRYNPTSHIFEQSLDEGTSWTKPPLHASIITEGVFDAARLGGSIAYTNLSNTFAPHQTFQSSIAAAGSIAGGGLYSINSTYVWPGRVDAGADGQYQYSWYLATHGSYGLYTNTGFYLAGGIYAVGAINCGTPITMTGGNVHMYWRTTNTGDQNQAVFRMIGWGDSANFRVEALYNDLSLRSTPITLYHAGSVGIATEIYFPGVQVASGNANGLDDYEEGLWYPYVTFNGNGAGIVHTVQEGNYIKIGRCVHVTGYVAINNKGAVAGQLIIGGLPFVNSSNTGALNSFFPYCTGVTGLSAGFVLHIPAGQANLHGYMWSGTTGHVTLTNAGLTNGFSTIMTTLYMAPA